MGLQFGRDKCVQMHVGKKHNPHHCTPCRVDAWDEVIIKHDGKIHKKDAYIEEEVMKQVGIKKYLGDIISQDMKNTQNIKEKTNKAVGIVN